MSEQFTRRHLFARLVVLSGAVLLPPCVAKANAATQWVPVGPAGRFKKGGYTQVTLPEAFHEEEVYITQNDDGSYTALLSRCTHKGCLVDWNGKDKHFECACHGGKFDQTGRNVSGPPQRPLPSLPTHVDDKGLLNVQVPCS